MLSILIVFVLAFRAFSVADGQSTQPVCSQTCLDTFVESINTANPSEICNLANQTLECIKVSCNVSVVPAHVLEQVKAHIKTNISSELQCVLPDDLSANAPGALIGIVSVTTAGRRKRDTNVCGGMQQCINTYFWAASLCTTVAQFCAVTQNFVDCIKRTCGIPVLPQYLIDEINNILLTNGFNCVIKG